MSSGGAILTKVGDPIRLNLQLWDGATGKFPQAVLRDVNGAELTGSPVDLTHTSNGLYEDDSITMPDTFEVTASFQIYDDSGHTTPSKDHADAFDLYRRDELGEAIEQLLSASRKADIDMTVEDASDLTAEMGDNEGVSATVSDEDELKATVEDADDLDASVDGDDTTITVEDC